MDFYRAFEILGESKRLSDFNGVEPYGCHNYYLFHVEKVPGGYRRLKEAVRVGFELGFSSYIEAVRELAGLIEDTTGLCAYIYATKEEFLSGDLALLFPDLKFAGVGIYTYEGLQYNPYEPLKTAFRLEKKGEPVGLHFA